jgi:hypothetical protein
MRKYLIGWVMAVTGIALLVGVLAPGDASAWDRGRGGFHHGFHGPRVFFGPRVFVGPRFYGGYYPYPYNPYYYGYPYPYYDYPPPVVVTPPPTDYVQRAPSTPVSGYWYYCQDPAGYYPTVAACPHGWIQVAPHPE